MDEDMVRESISDKMSQLGISIQEYAEMCGYKGTTLYGFLEEGDKPCLAILDAEGLKAVTYYEFKD